MTILLGSIYASDQEKQRPMQAADSWSSCISQDKTSLRVRRPIKYMTRIKVIQRQNCCETQFRHVITATESGILSNQAYAHLRTFGLQKICTMQSTVNRVHYVLLYWIVTGPSHSEKSCLWWSLCWQDFEYSVKETLKVTRATFDRWFCDRICQW